MKKQPKRILIIRTDRIGDVALSTPVIKALRDSYPGSYIAFMVRPYAKEIVEGNPYLEEVIVYDYDKCIRCYCCLELCPHAAIEKHQPVLKRMLGGLVSRR